MDTDTTDVWSKSFMHVRSVPLTGRPFWIEVAQLLILDPGLFCDS